MGLLNLAIHNPMAFILIALPLLYAIILHELAHGWVAYRLGDPTAKMLGRLSLNPLKHLDPIGTLMLFVFGFGWAKPVPVRFDQLRNRQMGMIMVSAAGVTANTLLAFLALLINRAFTPAPGSVAAVMLYYFAQINIILAAFNLIPLPPLDGSKILLALAPANLRRVLLQIEPYGFFIIIGLLYFGLLNPVIAFFRWMIVSLIHLLLP
jgi:Zn-dependent protease